MKTYSNGGDEFVECWAVWKHRCPGVSCPPGPGQVKTSVSIKVSRRKQEMAGPTSYLIKPRAPADGPPPPPNTHPHVLEFVSCPGTLKIAAFPWPCTFVYPVSHLLFRFPSECLDTAGRQQASLSLLWLLYHCCGLCPDRLLHSWSQLSSTWLCSQLNQTERTKSLHYPTFIHDKFLRHWILSFFSCKTVINI